MVHTSYKNVSSIIGNNILYYEAMNFITLSDGYYDLSNLNKILRDTGTKYYKLILADDTQSYRLWKFTSLTTWNQEDFTGAVDKTSLVQNNSVLNKHIYNMTFFNGI